MNKFKPTGEYERIVSSITDMVSKRFFAFPAASPKAEMDTGFFQAGRQVLTKPILVPGL